MRELQNLIDWFESRIPEVKDLITIIPKNIPQNSVNPGSSIGNEHHSLNRGIEDFGNRCTGLIQQVWISVTNEWVWSRFAQVLIFSLFLLDRSGECTK